VEAFLRRVWRDGALFGLSPAEAFFVKCDAENNPAENRDAGILTVEIGIAPVKPAEFVVFRISQFADGAGLNEWPARRQRDHTRLRRNITWLVLESGPDRTTTHLPQHGSS
jgi:hypothetical protein